MKFLILGCNGMAGHTISLYLKEQGHDVTGFARNKSKFVKTIVGDAFDGKLVEKVVGSGNYDSVVNCIGILNQNAEENKYAAVYLNALFPHFLVEITDRTETQIIHMSTDCVFSGKKGMYAEDDLRDGESFYDRSKALGEIDNDKDFTIRASIIGPDLDINGIGLLNWFLMQKGEITGYTKAIWTGMTTLELSKCIEKVATDKLHGLYNMVPNTSITKYDLLGLCNRYLRQNKVSIIQQGYPQVDKSLIRKREGVYYEIQGYEDMIVELKDWMIEHRQIYPHYEI